MSDDYGRRSSSYDPSEQAEMPTVPRTFSERHQSADMREKPMSDSLFQISDEGRIPADLKVGLTMPTVKVTPMRPQPTAADVNLKAVFQGGNPQDREPGQA